MITTQIITHGGWAAVVVAAFFVGDSLSPGGPDDSTAGTPGSETQANRLATKSGRSPAKNSRRPARDGSTPPSRAVDFAAAMEVVMAEPDEELRSIRANRLINGLNETVLDGLTPSMVPDLLQLFQEVRDTPLASRRTIDAHVDFIGAWARIEPEAAVRYASDPDKGYWLWKDYPATESVYMWNARREAQSAAITEWAKVDLAGAKEFVAGIDGGVGYDGKNARKEMTMGLMKQLTETDLEGAMAYSADLAAAKATPDDTPVLRQLVSAISKQRGMEGVKEWLETIPYVPGEGGALSYKESAVLAMGKQIPQASSTSGWPKEYVTFLKENAGEPFVTAALLTAEGRDPTVSIKQIIVLPEEIGARREAVGNEFQRFFNRNPEKAGEWLQGQERGPVFDEAILVYVRESTQEDLPTAMQWAREITDPALRAETIQYVEERGGR